MILIVLPVKKKISVHNQVQEAKCLTGVTRCQIIQPLRVMKYPQPGDSNFQIMRSHSIKRIEKILWRKVKFKILILSQRRLRGLLQIFRQAYQHWMSTTIFLYLRLTSTNLGQKCVKHLRCMGNASMEIVAHLLTAGQIWWSKHKFLLTTRLSFVKHFNLKVTALMEWDVNSFMIHQNLKQ